MKIKKLLVLFLCLILMFVFTAPSGLQVQSVSGSGSGLGSGSGSGPTITTTLGTDAVQRGSKKTFDVWARNSSGDKIKATVKLNGKKVEPTWDDNEKTSYTLVFIQEGKNIVTVSASSDGGKKKTLTYQITYQKAKEGEAIGRALWSVELFTIGCGYLIYPIEVSIYEGETAAEQLLRLLHDNGYVGYYGGSVKSSFYIGYIGNGTAPNDKYNNYRKSGTPANPKELNIYPEVLSMLVPYLEDTMTFFDPDDYSKNWTGYIGEFVITNGSGWMYSVNNIFPNVGFADCYLSDGDVVRVQFTLGYGADIGGFGSVGVDIPNVDDQPISGYYAVADKDELSYAVFRARSSNLLERNNVKTAYNTALSVMYSLNISQSSVNSAVRGLNAALDAPDAQSQNNGSQNNPEIPATSKTPETSKTPGMSEVPCTQETPGASETPDASKTLDTPETDDTSEEPDASEIPGFSEAPDTSGAPDTSEAPDTSKKASDAAIENQKSEDESDSTLIVIIALVFSAIIAVGSIIYLWKRNKERDKETDIKRDKEISKERNKETDKERDKETNKERDKKIKR